MMSNFQLLLPTTIAEASGMLLAHGERARLLAGGTDLFVMMKDHKISVDYLIDLNGIEGLDVLEVRPDGSLLIGARATFSRIVGSAYIRQHYPVLVDAMERIGSKQIRNVATIGGNLCNAVPSADSSPALLVSDAKLLLSDGKNERTLPLDEFFIGPRQTALDPGELLKAVIVPEPADDFTAAYKKFTRRKAMDLALLGVAVSCRLDGNTCSDARIALATAAPTAIRMREAEAFLNGKELTDENIRAAAKLASEKARPRTSFRATESYRRRLIERLTPRVFETAKIRLADALACLCDDGKQTGRKVGRI